MKKSLKIILVLAVICGILGGVAFWQRNNLLALTMAIRHSGEELDAQMQSSREELAQSAQSQSGVTVRDLTEEERQALKDQTLTPEELIDQLTRPAQPEPSEPQPTQPPAEPTAPEAPKEPQQPEAPAEPSEAPTEAPKEPPAEPQQPAEPVSPPAPTPEVPAEPPVTPPEAPVRPPVPEKSPEELDRELLNRYIAEIYVMKESYTNWLEETHQAAIDEFNALPEQERTTSKKYSIGLAYVAIGQEKEKEADARMARQEQKIREVLLRLGEPTDLVEQIHSAYLNEKAMKKAYYMSLH